MSIATSHETNGHAPIIASSTQTIGRHAPRPGVMLDEGQGAWLAKVRVDGELKLIGAFRSRDEAETAYEQVLRDHEAFAIQARVSARQVTEATEREEANRPKYPPGVRQIKRSSNFEARVMVNGKRITLGPFATIDEAAAAHRSVSPPEAAGVAGGAAAPVPEPAKVKKKPGPQKGWKDKPGSKPGRKPRTPTTVAVAVPPSPVPPSTAPPAPSPSTSSSILEEITQVGRFIQWIEGLNPGAKARALAYMDAAMGRAG